MKWMFGCDGAIVRRRPWWRLRASLTRPRTSPFQDRFGFIWPTEAGDPSGVAYHDTRDLTPSLSIRDMTPSLSIRDTRDLTPSS